MTNRMTVAITLLTAGLGVAALAGIPALVQNRSVGDAVMVCGLAVAIAGVVLMATAIPGVRRTKQQRERERQADIDDLKVKRKRITDQIRSVDSSISKLKMSVTLGTSLSDAIAGGRDYSQGAAVELRSLEDRRINLFAELGMNDNEMRRKGIEPDA